MPSIKDLKKRIGSVKNTQQTTKAMKMVSAAKLRRSQDAILNNRPYAKAVGALMGHILSLPNLSVKSKLLDLGGTTNEGGNLLLVVVTSDRGLCGGFNSNLIRYAQRWMRENSTRYASIELTFVGKRGFDFFRTKRVKVGEFFSEQGGKVTFQKAQQVSQKLVERFMSGETDEVKVLYNEFKNAVTQRPVIDNFLPLRPSTKEGGEQGTVTPSLAIVKPDPTRVLESLLEKHFAIQAFRIMLESQAGEHGARMSAMENATKNAGEMIRKLTLQFNKQRQAGITKELLEIIGGSESQKSA